MWNEEKAVVAIHPSIFIQLQEHWFMFLMESRNPSLRASWFERTDWVHGGDADTPAMSEDDCQSLLIIRVTEKDKDHTVFIK